MSGIVLTAALLQQMMTAEARRRTANASAGAAPTAPARLPRVATLLAIFAEVYDNDLPAGAQGRTSRRQVAHR